MANVGRQVRAVYDFSGEPGSAELSITAGEVLTVTRQDVGEGWWEGTNERGQTGLFPEAYVEEVSGNQPPSIPPPPLPDGFSDWGGSDKVSQVHSQRNTDGGVSMSNEGSSHRSYDGASQSYDGVSKSHDGAKMQDESSSQVFEGGDYWEDDDWDDDVESNTNFGSGGAPGVAASSHRMSSSTKTGSIDDDLSLGRSDSRAVVGKKNFNRFSAFGKSGLETFLLSQTKVDVPDSEVISIKETEKGIFWDPIIEPYSCVVASPKKESKLKGLKSFIAYQLTPSFNNIQVSRRYKHFDWLHERLTEKFCFVPIPPLPDKQISGRYEEQFIEHRRIQLQAFVDAMCRHPVLSRCSVWQHFITCTDEKRWKTGKRKEEKDKLLGVNYLFALQVPDHPMDSAYIEQEIENFARFIHSMDGAIKSLIATATDQAKKHQGPYKREYQKIGQAFMALGLSFEEAPAESSRSLLTNAVRYTGDAYNFIGKLFEEQPKQDWEPLADVLHIYKGVLASFPDIISLYRTAIQKRRDCERFFAENRVDEYQVAEVKRRTDLVSYALMAEIHHFHSLRAEDFRACMKNYITEQINFYEQIGNKLRDTLVVYEDE